MNIQLDPPRAVLRIAGKLEKAGFETWCVGGAIRDALLGHRHLDWDLATAARPQQVRALFPRTIPVGIEFGTIGVLDESGVMHEVTTYRRDVRTDGRHPLVEFGASLDEDLARRDYTINAMAWSPAQQKFYDPLHGLEDLERQIVRAVGDPLERMREDRLRALRAIRFAARFGFSIEAATWNAIVASAPHLSRLSAERVKQEIEKTMEQVKLPSRAFSLWRESGAFGALIPSLAEVTDLRLRAIDHICLPGLRGRPQRKAARLSALFASVEPGGVLDMLKSLRFSNADAAWISSVVARWALLHEEMAETMTAGPPSDAVLRRWAARAGRTRLASIMRLAHASWWAEREAGMSVPSSTTIRSAYRRGLKAAYNDPIELSDLAITGRDLEKLGLTGPEVGEGLRKLLEIVINDPATNTRAGLLTIAQSWRAAGSTYEDGRPQRQG